MNTITEEKIRALAEKAGALSTMPMMAGWHVVFPSGAVLSVQVGDYNYSGDNTAEIAAFTVGTPREWLWPEQVRGWQSEEQIEGALAELSALAV